MKFTSTPTNGSSWSDPLPFSFDTESNEPLDLTLNIASASTQIARRKLYGVTSGTIDIAPYLRYLSCIPPTIGMKPSITISPSALQVKVEAQGVSSTMVKLFHAPFDDTHPHALSYATAYQSIVRGEPILLTIFSNNSIQLSISYVSKSSTTQSTHSAKAIGLPMEIVVPTATINESVKSIVLKIKTSLSTIYQATYHIAEPHGTTKSLIWYNKMGGIERYTFPHVIRTSYKAKVVGEGNDDTPLPAQVKEASVHYRLCSAHESPAEIDRLSEIVFSPRVFLLEGEKIKPIIIEQREVIFDSHGTLKQLCVDITEPWEGGVR